MQGAACIEFTGSNADEYNKVFTTAYNSGVAANNAVLQFWYYISDTSKSGAQNSVEIGSAGHGGDNVYSWTMSKLDTGWNLITLAVTDASDIGEPDLNAINWFSLENTKTDQLITRIDEIQILDRNASAEKYRLTVNNGSGSGNWIYGESLSIIAEEAPAGYIFEKWIVNSGDPYISNKNARETRLRMSGTEAEVTATYKLTLNYLDDCDTDLNWNYANFITLTQSGQKQGRACLEYTGGGVGESSREFFKTFPNPYNSGATEASGILQFWYYISDVSKIGSSNQIELGSGGIHDVDEYSWKKNGRVSNGWNLLNLKFSEASKIGNPDLNAINWFRLYDKKSGPITSRIDGIKILSAENINKFSLLIDGGSGSGVYNANEEIPITAEAAPDGQKFESWIIHAGEAHIANVDSETTILTMSSIDAYVSALYMDTTSVSIPASFNKEAIKVYPNPSTGLFQVEIFAACKQAKFEIFNNTGRLVQTGYFENKIATINMPYPSKGTYILRLTTEAEVYSELLIIK